MILECGRAAQCASGTVTDGGQEQESPNDF